MGHSGYGEWDISVAAARDLPNVYLDLTSVPNPNDFARLSDDARHDILHRNAECLLGHHLDSD
jgi:hypothetical protein